MTEFFKDAWGNVSHTKCKCVVCDGYGVDCGETCFGCGGYGWVCEEDTAGDLDEDFYWDDETA